MMWNICMYVHACMYMYIGSADQSLPHAQDMMMCNNVWCGISDRRCNLYMLYHAYVITLVYAWYHATCICVISSYTTSHITHHVMISHIAHYTSCLYLMDFSIFHRYIQHHCIFVMCNTYFRCSVFVMCNTYFRHHTFHIMHSTSSWSYGF